MQHRIGQAPEAIEAKLHGLSPEKLDELALDVLSFNSYADAERWFTRH
jgi:hypothetical protein